MPVSVIFVCMRTLLQSYGYSMCTDSASCRHLHNKALTCSSSNIGNFLETPTLERIV